MNKRMFGTVIGVVAVALIAAIIVFALRQNAPQNVSPNDSPKQQTEETTQSSDSQSNTDDAVSEETKVEIDGFAFQPSSITVKRGTKVTWTNKDEVSHTVTADDGVVGGPKSELLSKDGSYSFTFNEVGEFPYHCLPHPQMTAKVTVVE